jgi:hypothetical protein
MSEERPEPLPAADQELLDAVRRMWERTDPVPGDLAERVTFALQLQDMEAELLRLEQELLAPAGARAEEFARTVTFISESLSVMVMIGVPGPEGIRIDGWVTDGGRLRVVLRGSSGEMSTTADDDGRFAFDNLGPGMIQLIFEPTPGAQVELRRRVITPAIQV